MNNIGRRPNREKEKKAEYREDLTMQINKKLGDKEAAKDASYSEFDVGSEHRLDRRISQNGMNASLPNEVTHKETDRAITRAVYKSITLTLFNYYFQEQRGKSFETTKKQKDQTEEVFLEILLLML